MKRLLLTSLVSLGLLTLATGSAWAQGKAGEPPPGLQGPSVSPYLNLLRPGPPALNYYGDVRPQQRYNAAISKLEADTSQLATDTYQETGRGGGINTGHPSQFLNYQRYFLTTGAAGLGQRQIGGGVGLAPPRGGALAGGLGGAGGGLGRSSAGTGSRGGR